MAAPTKPLVSDLVSCINSLPANYVRPESDRSNLSEVTIDNSIPLIDLQGLYGPDHSRVCNLWPSSYREDVGEYCKNARGLALRLLEAISESLGLSSGYINSALGKHGQHSAINFYPPCPQPELTYGLPGHADPNVITILLQDDVPGLQVLKEGRWIAVNPIPYSFIVNIGDQIQAFSNDCRKSLGLESGYINPALGKHGQHLAINFNAPCLQPELTYGLPGHANPNVTIIIIISIVVIVDVVVVIVVVVVVIIMIGGWGRMKRNINSSFL